MTTEDQNVTQDMEQSETEANPAQENATEIQEAEQTESQQQEETKTEEPKPEETVKKDPPKKPWERKRIDQLTWEKNEERRKREAAEALIAQLTNNTNEGEEGKQLTPVDVDRLVDQKANQKLATQNFNQKCDATAQAGKEKYEDFDDAVKVLSQLGLMQPQFLDAATDLPNSHEVLYYLGNNPEEAERLLNLTPTKQAMELARLEVKLAKPNIKPVSKAPAPITPIGGNSGSTTYNGQDPAKMSDEQYLEWRKTWK